MKIMATLYTEVTVVDKESMNMLELVSGVQCLVPFSIQNGCMSSSSDCHNICASVHSLFADHNP